MLVTVGKLGAVKSEKLAFPTPLDSSKYILSASLNINKNVLER